MKNPTDETYEEINSLKILRGKIDQAEDLLSDIQYGIEIYTNEIKDFLELLPEIYKHLTSLQASKENYIAAMIKSRNKKLQK